MHHPTTSTHLPESYIEILCIPTDCYEVFVDFIMHTTGLAIEEIATSTLPSSTTQQLRFFNIPGDRADPARLASEQFSSHACIIRYDPDAIALHDSPICPSAIDTDMRDDCDNPKAEVDPSSQARNPLIQALESFALVVSQRLGHAVGFAYTLSQKRSKDWVALYQASVMPLECGRYYIHPSWHLPKNGRENIIIDPALAFGSGHHASTFMCIEMLSQMDLGEKICLDVGCGSGILGIIMAKQGGIVSACDVDMLAVQETRKNFLQNGVSPRALWHGSINAPSMINAPMLFSDFAPSSSPASTSSPVVFAESTFAQVDSASRDLHSRATQGRGYDVICANIVADVLACMRSEFITALAPSGVLILSGIVEEKCGWILESFGDMRLLQQEHRDGWVGLKFALVT